MRIGIVQTCWRVGDIAHNCSRYERYTGEAARMGCEAVFFPELSDTGYDLECVSRFACRWPGPAFDAAAAAARTHGIAVFCGLSERADDGVYNAMAVWNREGTLCGHYRKVHLFQGPEGSEHALFRAGDSLSTASLDGVLWGMSICFDLRFPELYRTLALNGCRVVVNVAAWPAARIDDWALLCRARAVENQVYVVGVNHGCALPGGRFGGQSCLVDPSGKVVALGDDAFDGLLIGELDPLLPEACRQRFPVLQSRRPDVYQRNSIAGVP